MQTGLIVLFILVNEWQDINNYNYLIYFNRKILILILCAYKQIYLSIVFLTKYIKVQACLLCSIINISWTTHRNICQCISYKWAFSSKCIWKPSKSLMMTVRQHSSSESFNVAIQSKLLGHESALIKYCVICSVISCIYTCFMLHVSFREDSWHVTVCSGGWNSHSSILTAVFHCVCVCVLLIAVWTASMTLLQGWRGSYSANTWQTFSMPASTPFATKPNILSG